MQPRCSARVSLVKRFCPSLRGPLATTTALGRGGHRASSRPDEEAARTLSRLFFRRTSCLPRPLATTLLCSSPSTSLQHVILQVSHSWPAQACHDSSTGHFVTAEHLSTVGAWPPVRLMTCPTPLRSSRCSGGFTSRGPSPSRATSGRPCRTTSLLPSRSATS